MQGEAGYRPVSFLEPQATPETSGTGFVYAWHEGSTMGCCRRLAIGLASIGGWRASHRGAGEFRRYPHNRCYGGRLSRRGVIDDAVADGVHGILEPTLAIVVDPRGSGLTASCLR